MFVLRPRWRTESSCCPHGGVLYTRPRSEDSHAPSSNLPIDARVSCALSYGVHALLHHTSFLFTIDFDEETRLTSSETYKMELHSLSGSAPKLSAAPQHIYISSPATIHQPLSFSDNHRPTWFLPSLAWPLSSAPFPSFTTRCRSPLPGLLRIIV